MKNKIKVFIVLMVLNAAVYSQTGGNFTITKSSIDGGGGVSDGGGFVVSGTIGQIDASNELIGGNFKLTGGYWAQKTIPLGDVIFRNGFEN